MKKVLLVCDGNHFPKGAFEFISALNKTAPVFLTGVFLSSIQYDKLWFYPVDGNNDFLATLMNEDSEIIGKNIALFSKRCKENNIQYHVHSHQVDYIFTALKKESRFADLLVMSSELFYRNLDDKQPNNYTKTLLHEAECPVLLVPENATPPSNIILAYDDSEESVYAIKQFAYLLPELSSLETSVVFADEAKEKIPDASYIEELVQRHFSNINLLQLQIEPKTYFATWAEHYKSGLVVCGAFGRSAVSNFFRKSFITGIIRDHEMAVFIAHK